MLDINQPPRRSEAEIVKFIEEINGLQGADSAYSIRKSLMMFLPVDVLQAKGWVKDENVGAYKTMMDVGAQHGYNTPGRLTYHYLSSVWEKANQEVPVLVEAEMKNVMSWLWLMGFDEEFLNEEMGRKNGDYYGKKHLVIASTIVGLNWRNLDNGVWAQRDEDSRTELTEVMREAQVEDAGRIASEAVGKLLGITSPDVPKYERDPDAPPSASSLSDEEVERLSLEHMKKTIGDGLAGLGIGVSVTVIPPDTPEASVKPKHLPENKDYTDRLAIELLGAAVKEHGGSCQGCMHYLLFRIAFSAIANIAVNSGDIKVALAAVREIVEELKASNLNEAIAMKRSADGEQPKTVH